MKIVNKKQIKLIAGGKPNPGSGISSNREPSPVRHDSSSDRSKVVNCDRINSAQVKRILAEEDVCQLRR